MPFSGMSTKNQGCRIPYHPISHQAVCCGWSATLATLTRTVSLPPLCSSSCMDWTQLCFPWPREFLVTSGSHQSSLEPFMHPGLVLPRERPLLAFFQNVMDPLGEIFIGRVGEGSLRKIKVTCKELIKREQSYLLRLFMMSPCGS